MRPTPQPAIAVSGDFCQDDVVALSVGAFDAWQWTTGETTAGIAVTTPGVYGVTVTNALQCTASATVTVSDGVDFEVIAVSPICSGQNDGSISVSGASGGAPPYGYSLDGVSFISSAVFAGLSGGDYLLRVKDSAGCLTEIPVTLDSPSPVVLDAGEDRSIRLGESIVLDAQTNIAASLVD